MNETFQEFQDLLVNQRHYFLLPFRDPIPVPVEKEEWGQYLISACLAHAHSNCSGVLKAENIVAIHTFFQQFGVDSARLPEQIKTLEKLLRESPRNRFGRVLFDSFPDYALMSHELVDLGLIDLVIFTIEGSGRPKNPEDATVFVGTRQNYAGGVFGYRCVSRAMGTIRRKAPDQRIIPIKDAILYKDLIPPLLRIPDFFRTAVNGIYSSELL